MHLEHLLCLFVYAFVVSVCLCNVKLYEDYRVRLSKPVNTEAHVESSQPQRSMCKLSDDEDDCELIESIYNKMNVSGRTEEDSSELQIDLTEKIEVRVGNSLGMAYDVLSWWRCNSLKFPILSELARDVLAIQASFVASESAFSTSGRVLDPYRSSLTPYMVEVLLCTQQWLKCSYKSQIQVVNLVQMLEEVEFFESLDARNATAPT